VPTMTFYLPADPPRDPHFYRLTRARWYHRLWHLFKTRVLRRDCWEIYQIKHHPYTCSHDMVLTPMFMCACCLRYVRWQEGCADDRPELCDDCYAKYEKQIANSV